MLNNNRYNQNAYKFLFVIFCVTSVHNASFMKNFEKSKKNISALKDKASKAKDAVNQKKDSMKNQFDEAKGKFDKAKGKIDKTKGKFDEAKGKFDEAKGKFDEAKGKFDEAKGKFEETKGKFEEAKGRISKLNEEDKNELRNEENNSNLYVEQNDGDKANIANSNKSKDNSFDENIEVDINNSQKSKDKNAKKHFIISANVVSEFPNGRNPYKNIINPIQVFRKPTLKKLILENKFLLIFLIFLVTILILSIFVLSYFVVKNRPLEIIISGLFSCFYLANTIDCAFILSQNHLYVNESIEVLHCFILSIIFVIMGFSLGVFIMKEYASKRKLP